MAYKSDVALSMSHNVKDQILQKAGVIDNVDDYIIEKLTNPDAANEHGIFVKFNSVRWLHYADVNPTIRMIESMIEDHPDEARLVAIGNPDHYEMGEYDMVRCFYPMSFIEVEEPEDIEPD